MSDNFFNYITHSPQDEACGMVCTSIGYISVPRFTRYPPQKNEHPPVYRRVAAGRFLNEYQLIYVTKGEGMFEPRERKLYKVVPGSMLLVLPGMLHRYKPLDNTGWDEYWVGFRGAFFDRLVKTGHLNKDNAFFEIGLHGSILDTFNTIFEEVRAQKPCYHLIACSGIFSLIAHILSFNTRKENPTYYGKIVDKAKYIMTENIFKNKAISRVAKETGLSESRFISVFKKYTGMTPYQYYIQIKIHKAKTLLEQNLSVKETAYKLGFDDESHFSRLFSKKTGVPPSKWPQAR